MTSPSPFVVGLPKVELHVHHVGSVSPATVAALVERHGSDRVPGDPGALADYFVFRDFAHFVELYLTVVDLIRDGEDVRLLTDQIARDLAAQNVRYAELTLTPYTSVLRGVPIGDYIAAVEDVRQWAERDTGLVLRWIVDIPGELGLEGADATLALALDHGPSALVGFGLGGPEIGVPRPQFAPHFARARAAGLHSVPHAGESTGAQTVRDALDHLGAERVGHGIAAAEDPELMARLVAEGIALEICPTSNVRTRSVGSLAEHPLPALAAAGVPFSINSDDPPMFGTDLTTEHAVAADLLGLDADGTAGLARAALAQSFAPAEVRARIAAEIDAYVADPSAPRPNAGNVGGRG